jgi:DNA polymerase-3 subunit gamma/tau
LLRANWAAILDAIKRERRVAWILLSNASVLSVQDGILTLRFARDGDLKGFSTSGCDADLKRVLSARFGLNVMVKGVVGGDPGDGAASAPPGAFGSDAGASRAAPPHSAAPGTSRSPAARRPEVAAAGPYDEPPDEMPPDDDEPLPDEPSSYRPAPATTELTGMDLIQRELGGQVISEIEG